MSAIQSFACGASYQTCSYIVRTANGLVLVDAGMSSDGADVLRGLKELQASATDIKAILLTHWHNDHAAGAAAAHVLSGAPVRHLLSGGRWPLFG